MRKIILIIILIISIIGSVIYNIIDNNRVIVVEEEIEMKNLPNEFNDFTILQITDLHGKRFGEKQEELIQIINKLNYDMIAITGDIASKHTDDIEAFKELINGIENKKNMFFVFGNIDDEKYYDDIKNLGCNMLEAPFKIVRGNEHIWVSEYDFNKEVERDGINIGLTHIPIPKDVGNDLIIAGHYHGGQYRIPLFGAFFVPEVNGKGLFPKQNEVSGMQDFGSYKQYISRGLGASADNKLLEFRLFNTPEVNLIKLKANEI